MVEELDKEDVEAEAEGSEASEESEVMHGGPGQEGDQIIEGEGAPVREEGAEVEGAEATPKRKRFQTIEEAEAEAEKWKKSHREAEKRMHEATEEAARYRKMLTEGGKTTRTEQPKPRLAVWQRERETFDERVKAIPKPDMNDPKAIEDYNTKIKDIYFQTHSEFAEIAQTEKVAAKQTVDRITNWIAVEASKLGFTDDPIDLRNDDGTVEKGSLANVFWAVAGNPDGFGINTRDANGRFLPLEGQIAAIAKGINRFLDAYVTHRQNQVKKANREKSDLTVLRRSSSGPSRKGGEEEEESISSFADQIKANMKNRKRVGDITRRHRGED